MNRVALALALLVMPACSGAQETVSIVPQLERLAQRDNAEAIYFLGMAYQTGTGAPVDHVKALAYFQRAAALGDPLGAYKLGCFHAGQDGVLPIDPVQALKYKLIAASAGYALAQQDVALLYHARGDDQAALDWLGKAAAQGTADALMAYASVHNSSEFPRKPAMTAAYFQLYLDAIGGGDGDQRAWLADFRAKLEDGDRSEADRIAREYRPRPTPLTLKALAGERAATALIAASR